jgi:hypothetical protein
LELRKNFDTVDNGGRKPRTEIFSEGMPISSKVSRRAVTIREASSFSLDPPGKATSPL